MPEQQPFKCFDRGYLLRLVLASLGVFAIAFAAKAFERGTTGRIALVALEAVGMGYIIVETMRSLRRLDEMNLRIHFEAITVSFTVTAVVGTALMLLERAGLPLRGWDEWLWAFMVLMWGIGVWVVQRRYR